MDTTALVLVGVMPSPRDMEIARVLGWYRIPLRFAPKVIEVDYLAFYQTGAFGAGGRWQINAYAEMRGHELTTRQELFRDEPDHPRAREEYYKVALGPVQYLSQPIQAKQWRRVTFLYTTGELLHSAETINDLVVRSDEREVLWRSLRERALRSGQYHTNELVEFPMDHALLAMLGDLKRFAEIPDPYKVK